jgi:hypothetical protein
MITVGEAIRIAKEWVEAEAHNIPNFRGAFLIGSIIWKDDDNPHPAISDIDLKILLDIDDPKQIEEQGFIQHYQSFKGITLETIFSPFEEYSNPERILADFIHAAHFSVPNILFDPSGELTEIQEAVAVQYAQKKWVIKRIEGAREYTLASLDYLYNGSSADRWLGLAFALGGGLVQIPIQADLRPPTVRKAGVIYREIIENQGRQDLYDALLRLYGVQSMDPVDVERHFEDLSNTFDYALEIIRTPSMADLISPLARPVVINGARELIEDGFYNEAILWIASMRTLCQQTILQDAPADEQKKYAEQYDELLAELGFYSPNDFPKREEGCKRLLDEVMQVAEQIVEMNKNIIHR